jgi:hypothetical protein
MDQTAAERRDLPEHSVYMKIDWDGNIQKVKQSIDQL